MSNAKTIHRSVTVEQSYQMATLTATKPLFLRISLHKSIIIEDSKKSNNEVLSFKVFMDVNGKVKKNGSIVVRI